MDFRNLHIVSTFSMLVIHLQSSRSVVQKQNTARVVTQGNSGWTEGDVFRVWRGPKL